MTRNAPSPPPARRRARPTRAPRALCVAPLIVVALAGEAFADRPELTGEAVLAVPGGQIAVHYATAGRDVPLAGDADGDGVPDFVSEVAATAELALQHFLALGFRRPLDDGALGGDDRIDIYLRDLVAADGNAGVDSCAGAHCIGHISAENDYAGYPYPSITEGIRSVVPHELFHLVQNAYASGQPAAWSEGSAVWSVENLFGTGNSDFERFLPSFLTRSFRPFERAVGGFGDAYPYGAALWPYFLEQRFGTAAVVATWLGCEQASFLDAANTALGDTSIEDAWIEFTRWNAFTGAHAAGGAYPDARAWPEAPREPGITSDGTIYVEGISALYVPLELAAKSRVRVAPDGALRIAAWLVADGAALGNGIELAADGAALAATIDAGAYTLVVTGLARNTIATAVHITFEPPPAEGEDGDSGGCSTAGSSPAGLLAIIAVLARRRRGLRAC